MRPRVAIVGRGVLGSVAASRLSKSCEVTCFFRRSEPGHPQATSQRNHAWKQSGLLYLEDPELALQMGASGNDLMREFRLEGSSNPGVFGFHEDHLHLARQTAQMAERLGITDLVCQLPPHLAKKWIGPLFRDEYVYYRVPDGPFDEGGLLRQAARDAQDQGTKFVTGRARLLIDESGTAVVADAGDNYYEPNAVVVCAGRGTQALLHQLGLDDFSLQSFRSTLLRVADAPLHSCDLFVDRQSGLSIVQHGDICVVGSRGRVVPSSEDDHAVTADERDEVMQLLPIELRKRWQNQQQSWTGGIKTEGLAPDGRSRVSSVILGPREHKIPNLIVALPGKATLASYAVDMIESEIAGLLDTQENPIIEVGGLLRPRTIEPSHLDLADSAMHFDPIHHELNDEI